MPRGAAREPQIGDVFAVRGRKLLGRVVSTDGAVGPTHGCVLVYVYRDPAMSRDALLVPPMLTTRAPFHRGLFEHRGSKPLMPQDYFERHAFRDASGRLYDEQERPLGDAPGVPVGEHRLFDVDAVTDAIASVPGGYEFPVIQDAPIAALRTAARELREQWKSAMGRDLTPEEWAALYEPE